MNKKESRALFSFFLPKFGANIKQLFELMIFTSKFFTEIGWLKINGTRDYITSIVFSDTEPCVSKELPALFKTLDFQLSEYFHQHNWCFSVPLQPKGTDFQRNVWKELQKISFGTTISYQELAKRLGNEKLVRAAASANGKNPISILIPCHRVIGKDGKLIGYSGGIHRKEYLLTLEKGERLLNLF